MPGLRVRVFFWNSARGTVYCSRASRGGKTAAVRPSALRSSAKWVASASPGVTMQSTRPRSFCRAAYSRARPAGGRPNSAAGPGVARLAEIFWYSAVCFSRDSYIVDLLSFTASDYPL